MLSIRGIAAGLAALASVAAPHANAQDHAEGEIVKVGDLDVTWNDEGYHYVAMNTSEGEIVLELDSVSAPVSVENFLQYVDDGFYDDLIFHRVIPNFMIQGGGFDESLTQKDPRDPIVNEWRNGLKNNRGSIAMARTNVPDSATSQFYINVVNNGALDRERGGAAYAVFGRVVEGMDVVDIIRNVQTGPRGVHKNVPLQPVTILTAARIEDEKRIASLREGGFDDRRKIGWAAALERADKEWANEVVERRTKMTEEEQFAEAMEYVESEGFDISKGAKTDSGLWFLSVMDGEDKTWDDGTVTANPDDTHRAMIHYRGYFTDGKKFDDSKKGGRTNPMIHPVNRFIPGFTEALKKMQKGSKAVFVIPSRLAYGPQGKANIPANQSLIFIVDLIDYQ